MNTLAQLPESIAEQPAFTIPGLEPLLSTAQLTTWTGYSRSTIGAYRARDEDPLPSIRLSNSVRFVPSEVLAWLKRESARLDALES